MRRFCPECGQEPIGMCMCERVVRQRGDMELWEGGPVTPEEASRVVMCGCPYHPCEHNDNPALGMAFPTYEEWSLWSPPPKPSRFRRFLDAFKPIRYRS